MVNGFSGIFMVASVAAVSNVPKTRREEPRIPYSDFKKENGVRSFARILEENVKETKAALMDCNTMTYGRDSRMRDFSYQAREYHY